MIFDEFDKLKDEVLLFFITLFNRLEGKCGIVVMGTDYLDKHVRRGCRLERRGYEEIFSRVGRTFIPVPVVNDAEVTKICKENGVEDEQVIKTVCNTCEGDLRRIKREVLKYKLMRSNAA